MAITKAQAIDILDKFEFFQGQRAGRELWNIKPFDAQDQDIKDFSRDVALLKEYISDVVPKSEVEALIKENERWMMEYADYRAEVNSTIEKAKSEVAREIFAEIENTLGNKVSNGIKEKNPDWWLVLHIVAELKKKYTEGE